MYRFTEEELRIAKAVDLVDLAVHRNVPLKKRGRFYYVDGMDSFMIFNRSTWYRYSRGTGGSTIDFLMYLDGMTFKESVSYLLDFAGYSRMENGKQRDGAQKDAGNINAGRNLLENRNKEMNGNHSVENDSRMPFILPEKAPDCWRLYGYLMKRRGLSKEIIRYWLEKGLMYESLPYHNIVFLGRDVNGTVRFASQRGIQDAYGKPFKGDVPGNDKRYGVNLTDPECGEIYVYEAAIDAMSDMELRKDHKTSVLVLGMLSDGPLRTILEEYPHIRKIRFCLDNDKCGREAAEKLTEKYTQAGYEAFVRLPPSGKDYNEFLQMEREKEGLLKQPLGQKIR